MLNIVKFPKINLADIPESLRRLANSIEAGEFGAAHTLAWVIDCGNGKISVGLLGEAAEPALTAHFLLTLGLRELENVRD
jgi:hypothetical protein